MTASALLAHVHLPASPAQGGGKLTPEMSQLPLERDTAQSSQVKNKQRQVEWHRFPEAKADRPHIPKDQPYSMLLAGPGRSQGNKEERR